MKHRRYEVGHISADHDEFAVGHVDHIHQTEDDHQSQRGDEQHGRDAESIDTLRN